MSIHSTPNSSHGAFDEHHPPEQELLDECVHCGFCLPTCPTYLTTGEELESPRGRIHLMDMAAKGEIPLDDAFGAHMDSCLGCLACVSSCPSGVQYDKLIESVRPQVERNIARSPLDRLFRFVIFAVFPYPNRLRVAALFGALYQRLGIKALVHKTGLTRRLPPRLRALEGMMPEIEMGGLVRRVPKRTIANGSRRLTVGMLAGCAQRVFFSNVNSATARVFAAEGCDVIIPKKNQCCGALNIHAGCEDAGLERARRTIELFERHDVDVVVANVAGCGSSMKDYAHLLRDDPMFAERARTFSAKVRDVSEILAELPPIATRHPIQAKVAYHDACHLANAQQIRQQPRELLTSIPGIELAEVAEADVCCGSAGVYNLLEPDTADELGRRKGRHLTSSTPDIIATANAGCLLQIRNYIDDGVPLKHPIQLLDASIRGVPIFEDKSEP